jgi:hypothetical protein
LKYGSKCRELLEKDEREFHDLPGVFLRIDFSKIEREAHEASIESGKRCFYE